MIGFRIIFFRLEIHLITCTEFREEDKSKIFPSFLNLIAQILLEFLTKFSISMFEFYFIIFTKPTPPALSFL